MREKISRRVASAILLAGALFAGGCVSNPKLNVPDAPPVAAPVPLKEIRGVWVTNVDSDILTSKRKIVEGMDALSKAGINIIYPVVWNKALTLYPSDVAPTVTGVRMDPVYGERDPLQELVVEAHARGMEVVPWFEFGFSSSYSLQGGPIVAARPHWKAIDPEGNLVVKNGFDWLNALDPEVQEFMASLVLEVAERYDVDGIQGDDRLPAMPTLGGYDEATRARYKQETGRDVPDDIKDEHWVRWRADILTEWLAQLHARIKAIDPNLTVSMSPSYYPWALFEYLQDSYTWTNRGIVDTLHPQAYRYQLEAYQKIIDELVSEQFTAEQLPMLAPGLLVKAGSYRIPNDYFLGAIKYNREKGVNGEVHFFYTGLRENDSELLRLLQSGPYANPAALPYRQDRWRPGAIHLSPIVTMGDTTHWAVRAPRAATYDVYVKAVEGAPPTTFYLADSKDGLTLDASKEAQWGWIKLATVTAGESESVVVRSQGGGEVMLLLNRKLSPDVVWK
jgi:uncharacterized lipoprotein YddW (UPF0748 family)